MSSLMLRFSLRFKSAAKPSEVSRFVVASPNQWVFKFNMIALVEVEWFDIRIVLEEFVATGVNSYLVFGILPLECANCCRHHQNITCAEVMFE